MTITPQKPISMGNAEAELFRIIREELIPAIRRVRPEKQIVLPSLRDADLALIITAQILIFIRLKDAGPGFHKDLQNKLLNFPPELCKTLSPRLSTNIIDLLDSRTLEIIEHMMQVAVGLTPDTWAQQELMGHIYQTTLPESRRKTLAAYYTRGPVVKFLLCLLVEAARGTFFDPACGAGAFLVGALQRMHELQPSTPRENLLTYIKGTDIAPMATFSAQVNLVLETHARELLTDVIVTGDIFNHVPEELGHFNYIVGNPPFSRGERLPASYKDMLHDFLTKQKSPAGIAKADFSARNMPLHGYFLLDMDRFLAPGNPFGVILPASTLHLANLKGVRQYLCRHYLLDYVITSSIESFSIDTDLKEIMLVGHLRATEVAMEETESRHEVRFVVLNAPISLQNYAESVAYLKNPTPESLSKSKTTIQNVPQERLSNYIEDWTTFLPNEGTLQIESPLLATTNMCTIHDLETSGVEAFRGYRADLTRYWAVPNPDWILKHRDQTSVTIENIQRPDFQITLPVATWLEGISRAEFYLTPTIEQGNHFILRAPGGTEKQRDPLAKYVAWVKDQLEPNEVKKGKFTRQLSRVGLRFAYAGRIALCHRIDFTTSRIICFFSPTPLQLNQNWFSIRGLDPVTEEFLAAWFNSTPFIAMFAQRWRAQRGPFGQTAMHQFRQYYIPIPSQISKHDMNRVMKHFRAFNQSSILHLSLNEQISLSLTQETDRRKFDLEILDALQVFASQPDQQRKYLLSIYEFLVDVFKKIRKQKGSRSF